MEAFKNVVYTLRDRYLPYHEGHLTWQTEKTDYNLKLPPWLCQPYVREPPQEHIQKSQEDAFRKREYKDEDGNEISRKRSKKLKRIARRPNRVTSVSKRSSDRCLTCPNPLGFKCEYKLCRQCCRNKCYIENLDCAGHRNLTKTRRQMAKEFEAKRKSIGNTITLC